MVFRGRLVFLVRCCAFQTQGKRTIPPRRRRTLFVLFFFLLLLMNELKRYWPYVGHGSRPPNCSLPFTTLYLVLPFTSSLSSIPDSSPSYKTRYPTATNSVRPSQLLSFPSRILFFTDSHLFLKIAARSGVLFATTRTTSDESTRIAHFKSTKSTQAVVCQSVRSLQTTA